MYGSRRQPAALYTNTGTSVTGLSIGSIGPRSAAAKFRARVSRSEYEKRDKNSRKPLINRRGQKPCKAGHSISRGCFRVAFCGPNVAIARSVTFQSSKIA